MSLQRQFQSTSIPDDLQLTNDLNEASSDDRWITSNESFAPDWMNDDAENKRQNQIASKDSLPRVVARMPNLKPSLSFEDRSQHLGKIFFDLFASRNRRWVGTLVVLALVGGGFGLWNGRTSEVAPTGFSESDELETTVVVHSESPISPKNKLASLTSNAIKSLSDDQNSIPADGSFSFEANDGVLAAFHYEPTESSSGYQSVYAARGDDGSAIPETENSTFPENFDQSSNRFENYNRFSENGTNQNGSLERSRDFHPVAENSIYGIPTNYSSPNSYNSLSDIPVNWDDLNDETRSSQPENSSQSVGFYSNEPLKNDIQHFKPVQRNSSDIRFGSEQNFDGQNYRSVARPSDFNGNGYSNGSPFVAQNQNVAVQNDASNYSNAGVYYNDPNSPNVRTSFDGAVPNNYNAPPREDRRSFAPNVPFQNFVPQNGAANQTGGDGRSGTNGNVGDDYSRRNAASMNYSSSDQGYSPNNLR